MQESMLGVSRTDWISWSVDPKQVVTSSGSLVRLQSPRPELLWYPASSLEREGEGLREL